MNKASQATMTLSQAGLINNPNICIKNYGATVVCVCKPCMEEIEQRMADFIKQLSDGKDLEQALISVTE